MRKTHASVAVALALMADPDARHWGWELKRLSGVRSGVLYPVLDRMLTEGWLSDEWEDPAETEGKRPPRRYYVVTASGREALGRMLDAARTDPRFSALLQTKERDHDR